VIAAGASVDDSDAQAKTAAAIRRARRCMGSIRGDWAPKVVLEATHEDVLDLVPLRAFKRYALDPH
jgi:uncharacterized protein (DUF2237 family)